MINRNNSVMRVICALAVLTTVWNILPQAYADGFLTNAPMSVARRAHTATLLLDGTVLVAGGDTSGGSYLTNAEVFNPTTDVWLPKGSLTTPRAFHTATLLPNGKVLVTGGIGINNLATAELYDPATGIWTATGSMINARYQHTAVLLPNGKVLVAGGINLFSDSSPTAELYDPATGTWSSTGTMNAARWRFTTTLLPNGKVLAVGGGALIGGLSFTVLSSAEEYDPGTETWTLTNSLTIARFDHTSVLLGDGKVLVTAGFDNASSLASTEIYNPATGTWTGSGALNVGRDTPAITILPNGKVLITGGLNATHLATTELFNPVAGSWTNSGSMSDARWQHTATLLEDGKVLLAGGFNGTQLASTEFYDSGIRATNGILRVTITPSDAIAAGAQWQLDGGAFQASGAVLTNLVAGNHVVSFKPVAGWATPSDQILNIVSTAGFTNHLSGGYALHPGSLQVTINPPGAVTAGAEWRVDGLLFQASGTAITNLSVGTHVVSFKTIPGWFAPGNRTVMIESETTTNISGTYSLNSGSLMVTINPSGAVDAGALWQVDGGVFQTNGAMISGLATGDHVLTFSTVAGWITPASQTVTITADATNSALGEYVSTSIPSGALSVTISPAGAVTAGAKWNVDGGVLRNSGAVVSGLGISNHTVSFISVAGWITPGDQVIAVAAGVTNTTTGVYSAAETVKPTFKVNTPTLFLRVTNPVFTATGTAKDNVRVANVFYQLNGNAWASATTVNNFTNWTAPNLVLTPGTNFFRTYAVDTSNNKSSTNTVRFVYVLRTRLGIAFNGRGTISPNYSNALLEIGKNYSMTATKASGFTFTNWTGSLTSNAAKLTFNMQSNLSFTVNFRDTTRPVNTFKTPTSNKRLSNEVFTATGAAKDNVGVSNVWYQLNNGGWSNAVTLNNWTNWTAPNLLLTPGTNILRTYAADSTGNRSLTNTVRFIYVLSDRVTVSFNGKGTLSPNYSNAVLEIGKNYSMTAKASTGFRFLNWTGSLSTVNSKLTFNMQSNLNFTANFLNIERPIITVTNPTVNRKLTNAVFIASGKTSDNVGVSNVWYQLNGGAWDLAALAVSRTSWTTPPLPLRAGSNQLQVFAMDAVGNRSLTNRVRFTYKVSAVADWAPDSLNGLLARVTPGDSNSIASVGFDVTTFAQTGVDTNGGNYGVGNYLYTKLATNAALLGLTFTAPPTESNKETQVTLVFTNHYRGYFTNEAAGSESGGVSFVIATNFLPGTLVGKTLVAVPDDNSITNKLKFVNSSVFTATTSTGHASSGFYTFTRFSPVSGMMICTFTNALDVGKFAYVQTTFTNSSSGRFFLTSMDNLGTVQGTGGGRLKLQ